MPQSCHFAFLGITEQSRVRSSDPERSSVVPHKIRERQKAANSAPAPKAARIESAVGRGSFLMPIHAPNGRETALTSPRPIAHAKCSEVISVTAHFSPYTSSPSNNEECAKSSMDLAKPISVAPGIYETEY
jgi:hypothetical protein